MNKSKYIAIELIGESLTIFEWHVVEIYSYQYIMYFVT